MCRLHHSHQCDLSRVLRARGGKLFLWRWLLRLRGVFARLPRLLSRALLEPVVPAHSSRTLPGPRPNVGRSVGSRGGGATGGGAGCRVRVLGRPWVVCERARSGECLDGPASVPRRGRGHRCFGRGRRAHRSGCLVVLIVIHMRPSVCRHHLRLLAARVLVIVRLVHLLVVVPILILLYRIRGHRCRDHCRRCCRRDHCRRRRYR
mmetsp:Transcript_23473/g.58160  ORF Transcript_23473/g.58160 Transcript_23473/m.58160 type:complete len:205 (+) Transcript_23473:602-1216(+)